MSATEVITDPQGFFERLDGDVPLGPAAVIVLVVTVLTAVAQYLQTQFVLQALPQDAQQFAAFVTGISVVLGILGAIVAWVILAGIMHLLSAVVYDGDADFTDTLAITGWGYAPRILGAALTLVVVYYVFTIQGVSPPDLSSQQAIMQYTQQIQRRPAFLLSTIVGIVLTVWSGFIWASGISEVHDVELSEAGVVAGVPVVLSLLFAAYSLLSTGM